MRRLIALAIAGTVTAPAMAAERTWPVASFERLRVEGSVAVEVATGSPAARGTAADRATLDRVTIARDGNGLVVRLTGAMPAGLAVGNPEPLARVTLSTPRLAAVTQQGSAPLTVARLSGDRVDIATTGGGALSVATINARMLAATVVGGGTVTLAGSAARARLTLNGDGQVDAAALDADEASLSLVGKGAIRAAARYAAQVIASGGGTVEVAGKPRCSVRANSEATVRCAK